MAKKKSNWFVAPGVPRITAPIGTREWCQQVHAYGEWLDAQYAQTTDGRMEPVHE